MSDRLTLLLVERPWLLADGAARGATGRRTMNRRGLKTERLE